MLKPSPESPLSKVISSAIHSGLALPFIWASRLNSDDTFLIIPFEVLIGFFLVDVDRLSSLMSSTTRTFVTICLSAVYDTGIARPNGVSADSGTDKAATITVHADYFWKSVFFWYIFIIFLLFFFFLR